MKIAITAGEPTLDANLDPRFGRCGYFLIVETNTMDFEAIENPNAVAGGGAGIQSGQVMAAKDVKFVLTGSCGPNAHEALSAAGVKVISRCSGGIRDAIELFKAGRLHPADEPNATDHAGMADPPTPFVGESSPLQPRSTPGGGMGRGRGGRRAGRGGEGRRRRGQRGEGTGRRGSQTRSLGAGGGG